MLAQPPHVIGPDPSDLNLPRYLNPLQVLASLLSEFHGNLYGSWAVR